MTHAFFKGLLFLAAGSVIHAMGGDQEMPHMGGLRSKIPITFWTMFIATFAIAGIPGFAGFFSKDEILEAARYLNPFGRSGTDRVAGLSLRSNVPPHLLDVFGKPRRRRAQRGRPRPPHIDDGAAHFPRYPLDRWRMGAAPHLVARPRKISKIPASGLRPCTRPPATAGADRPAKTEGPARSCSALTAGLIIALAIAPGLVALHLEPAAPKNRLHASAPVQLVLHKSHLDEIYNAPISHRCLDLAGTPSARIG